MNLHSEIMNIQICDKEVEEHFTKEAYAGYKVGKREMRSDAAELSLKAEARIEELEEMLSRLVKENDLAMPNENYEWMYSPMRVECLKVLESK